MAARRRVESIQSSLIILLTLFLVSTRSGGSCAENAPDAGRKPMKIVFLHHSTGEVIWRGGVAECFERHNRDNGTSYRIEERAFPKRSPYGWNNYPYDYWNIWARHGGPAPFMEEPTLEMLTGGYDLIVFKHCFPVSDVLPDTGRPDISSEEKRLENYKLQYEALKRKLHEFPKNKFVVWTAPPRVEVESFKARLLAFVRGRSAQRENAERAAAFAAWVRGEWDEPGDNIFLWDYHRLATEGGLFLKKDYAEGPGNSHPNAVFAKEAAPAFCRRMIGVIEGRGDSESATGR
jgi:hypothetical protein